MSPFSPAPASRIPFMAMPAISLSLTTPLRRTPRILRSKNVSPSLDFQGEDASRCDLPGAKRGVQ